ncbi:MurR/RpiR family transcriptional regulator [Methylobacterium sp.]|uniref:MurR/RpiR family transcriptional regulator n=1 Tax=Methylobacterium sp. TaxID=409 RepID=UPI003AFFF2B0
MALQSEDASVTHRIAKAFPALSAAHRQVARFVLDHPLKVATLPVNELADLVGVSVATANRFARAVGYEGYAKFRAALVLSYEKALAPVEKLRVGRDQPATVPEILDGALADIIRNIEATRRTLDGATCTQAVQAIHQARRVYVVGLGSSSWPAGILARNLDVNREDVHLLATLEGPGFAARTLRRLTPDDLVVVLATPRYFADTVRLAQIARRHGAAVLALTDGPHSPLVATATLALYAQTDCHYFAASDASLTALVEALASAFAFAAGDLVPAATRVTEAVLPWLDRDYAAWPPQGGADDLSETPQSGAAS